MVSVAGSLTAMNILLAVLCGAVAWLVGYRLYLGSVAEDVKAHWIGVMFFAGGWAGQRLYWAINRGLEALGYDYLLTSLYKSYSWITLIPMSVVVIGIGLILEPILHQLYGELWLLKYIVTCFVLWLTIAVLM